MKMMAFFSGYVFLLVVLPGLATAQVPVVPPRITTVPVVTKAIVPARVVERPVAVAPAVPVEERPIVREAVAAPARVVSWWDAFGKMRYGFYDDGFADDNWFYDYYET